MTSQWYLMYLKYKATNKGTTISYKEWLDCRK